MRKRTAANGEFKISINFLYLFLSSMISVPPFCWLEQLDRPRLFLSLLYAAQLTQAASTKYTQEIVKLKVAQITKNEMLPGQTNCKAVKSAVIPSYS